MTANPAPQLPCRAGLRCPMPGNKDPEEGPVCEHELHPDDFFEPDTADLTDDEAETALAAYKPVESKALWACKLDCPMRSQCLEIGMQDGMQQWGIFGGWTSSQRRAVQRDIKKRAEARRSQSDD